jgi:hypothetical protein
MEEHARLGSVVYFAFGAVNALTMLSPPGIGARLDAFVHAAPKLFPFGIPTQSAQMTWFSVLVGIPFACLPIWFLVRRKPAFVAARTQRAPAAERPGGRPEFQ